MSGVNLTRCNETATKSLVSIIMPRHNAGKFIEQAIQSVQHQTFENWELLICDDRSVDSSIDIAKQYSKKMSALSC